MEDDEADTSFPHWIALEYAQMLKWAAPNKVIFSSLSPTSVKSLCPSPSLLLLLLPRSLSLKPRPRHSRAAHRPRRTPRLVPRRGKERPPTPQGRGHPARKGLPPRPACTGRDRPAGRQRLHLVPVRCPRSTRCPASTPHADARAIPQVWRHPRRRPSPRCASPPFHSPPVCLLTRCPSRQTARASSAHTGSPDGTSAPCR